MADKEDSTGPDLRGMLIDRAMSNFALQNEIDSRLRMVEGFLSMVSCHPGLVSSAEAAGISEAAWGAETLTVETRALFGEVCDRLRAKAQHSANIGRAK